MAKGSWKREEEDEMRRCPSAMLPDLLPVSRPKVLPTLGLRWALHFLGLSLRCVAVAVMVVCVCYMTEVSAF